MSAPVPPFQIEEDGTVLWATTLYEERPDELGTTLEVARAPFSDTPYTRGDGKPSLGSYLYEIDVQITEPSRPASRQMIDTVRRAAQIADAVRIGEHHRELLGWLGAIRQPTESGYRLTLRFLCASPYWLDVFDREVWR